MTPDEINNEKSEMNMPDNKLEYLFFTVKKKINYY